MTYVDIPAIIQVIGGIFLNNALLDNINYNFNEDDFTEEFHKILFGSLYNLHVLGDNKITIQSIGDYLAQRPKSLAVYKANKGDEYLQKISEHTQLASFDYYYNRMKKMTLLRMYAKIGMNLSWLYDTDNIFDLKKKQAQEDWLDNTPLEEIAEIIDNKIIDIRLKYVDNATQESINAGEGALELLDKLKETPEVGVPLYGHLINTITSGARLKKLYLRSAATGIGKALPNSTVIPTPNGQKQVGEIKPGDLLFDAFGKPTLVKAIYPQGEKEVWEITFKDGRKAKCCEEHLWSYCTEGQRKEQKINRKFYTKTLKEINEMPLYQPGHGYKILVPMQKAVEYPAKQYYLKPYTFGLLLGDGSFRYNNTNKGLCFSSENDELPTAIAQEMNWHYKKCSDYNYNWMFENPNNNTHTNIWVEEALRDFPALWQAKSETKFIPREYLEGSIEQRFDLLNGLLDTDGSVDKEKGRISYYTVSPQLRDNVIELSLSLGFKATWLEDNHNKDNLPLYKIEIAGSPENKIKLFKLKRKHELILQWYNNGRRKEENLFNPIVKIEKLNYKEEMTCFYVDNNEHLFLMNDYIVTHNTRAMIADACYIACDEIYDREEQKWVKNGTKEPTLFISTEQETDEIQTMMIAFLFFLQEDHILNNAYEDGEWERVVYAANLLKNSPIYIQLMPDFSLKDIENNIKVGVYNHDVRYVFLDYLHSSMKILSEITAKTGIKGLREDNILFMISIRLKDLCNQYSIFIMSATQLNGDYRTAAVYDQNLLRGAKSIADKIDMGALMLETVPEDIESLKPILSQGQFETPEIKMSIYKNRRNKYKGILLWCKADRGTCKIIPMFATNYNYEMIPIDDVRITVEEEKSAF